jgi:ketosteroid isomerase-like protein
VTVTSAFKGWHHGFVRAALCCMAMTIPVVAMASDRADAVAAATRFLSVSNAGDVDAAVAMCDPEITVIDEFPPFVWSGPTACSDWFRAVEPYYASVGHSGDTASITKVLGARADGDRAYVVMRMAHEWKEKGTARKQKDLRWTVVLKKHAGGWRVLESTFSGY